jgi:Mrp family chromosome partitioning ATPase
MRRPDARKDPPDNVGRPGSLQRFLRYLGEAWIGVAAAAAIFAGFVAYAFLAPATYRTTAQLVLEPTAGAKLPGPEELAQSITKSALDDETLRSLVSEAVGPDGDKAAAALRIRSAFELDTADGRTFNLTFSDRTAERTRAIATHLARRAAERLPKLLTVPVARPVDERRQRTLELSAFLAEHPEVADAPLSPEETAPADAASDPVVSALQAERRQLEAELAARGKPGSDNPYDDPNALDVDGNKLERRLAEINSALAARTKSLKRAPSAAPRIAPQIESEWRRLLQAVARAKAPPEPPPPAPALTASVVDAPLPTSPIAPDRRSVLLMGALVTLGTGISLGLGNAALARARPRRRRVALESPNAAGPEVRVVHGSSPPAPMDAARGTLALSHAQALLPPATGATYSPGQDVSATFLQTLPSHNPVPTPRQSDAPRPSSEPPRPNYDGPIQPAIVRALTQTQPLAPEPQPERSMADEPKRTAVGLGVPAELLAQAQQPQRTGSEPARPIVEINTTVHSHSGAEPNDADAEAAPHTERIEEQGRRAAARKTQMLGSPIPPVMPVSKRGAPPTEHAANRSRPPAADTSYSYVSSSPPEPTGGASHREREATPRDAAPREATPRDAAPREATPRDVTPEARRREPSPAGAHRPGTGTRRDPDGYLSTPPPGAPLGGRIIVTPYPPQAGWSPSRSLNHSSRRPLCERIYPFTGGGCSVIGVSGISDGGHKKSIVAAELALALAEGGNPRVLLLEGDFHWPNVHRLMRVEMPLSTGFSQQLRAHTHGQPADRFSVVECSPTLHVLGEGVMRSPGLILTKQFEESVRALRTYYDFIVIDGPSIDAEIDCHALSPAIDGAVLVGFKDDALEFARAARLFPNRRFVLGVSA